MLEVTTRGPAKQAIVDRERARHGGAGAGEHAAQAADDRFRGAALFLRENVGERVREELVKRLWTRRVRHRAQHRAAAEGALQVAQEAPRCECGEHTGLVHSYVPVEVRQEEADRGALWLEEVEECEARGAGGAVDGALEGVEEFEDEARAGREGDVIGAGLDGAEDSLGVDVVPRVEAMAMGDANGDAADDGGPRAVRGVDGEAGMVGEAECVEEDSAGVGVKGLRVVVAREEHAASAGLEEGGEGIEEVAPPGLYANVRDDAAEESRCAGHVERRGAVVDLEEVEDIAREDEGRVGTGVGAEESGERGTLVERREGTVGRHVEVGEDDDAGGH